MRGSTIKDDDVVDVAFEDGNARGTMYKDSNAKDSNAEGVLVQGQSMGSASAKAILQGWEHFER